MPTAEEERVRITARVTASLHDRLEEAAGLSGATLNQFVVEAAAERARQVIERETVIRLSREDAKKVFDLVEHPPKANKSLKQAIKLHREMLGGA